MTLAFPFAAAGATPQSGKARHTQQTADLTGKRIVIVEDEGITQMQLQRLLARAGLKVVGSAVNGSAGVEIVLREQPDIVLMDIKMSSDTDGLDAAKRILEQYPVCIVMLTAYVEHEEQARQIGASGYILKPITGATLIPRLQQAFAQYRQS